MLTHVPRLWFENYFIIFLIDWSESLVSLSEWKYSCWMTCLRVLIPLLNLLYCTNFGCSIWTGIIRYLLGETNGATRTADKFDLWSEWLVDNDHSSLSITFLREAFWWRFERSPNQRQNFMNEQKGQSEGLLIGIHVCREIQRALNILVWPLAGGSFSIPLWTAVNLLGCWMEVSEELPSVSSEEFLFEISTDGKYSERESSTERGTVAGVVVHCNVCPKWAYRQMTVLM